MVEHNKMNQQMQFPLFGKKIEIGFQDIDSSLIELYRDDIIEEAYRLQKIFNLFDEQSELSILNKQRIAKVSPELLEVLETALKFCSLSENYDISKGYNFLAFKKKINYKEISCSYKNILLDGNTVTLTHKDVIIDLGSIAKGYIVDKLEEFIFSLGFENFYLDARGDIKMHEFKTIIEIAPPREESEKLEFEIETGGIATSGDYKQYNNNFEDNHLLGKNKFSSVTVINESLMIADAIATAILLNKNNFINKIKSFFPTSKIIIFDKKGTAIHNDLEI